ncbi:Histidine N-alpha-methyltransferase [Halomicronema hongdechloris C2206]|uniref:Histidine N-alpha-methyltransferase n=1 Tax=Halomicronema hongdechloris C2206 TaxID=1641165 RepID=A0A1Z3HHL3_9CYAN|nr:L-histidine N(alpha)-methyltransferase [Halomicronema hongdechloris]ASC69784.1 Histidine N-alpha-methyltransferase [Halomicronema hongdechloris C2206]
MPTINPSATADNAASASTLAEQDRLTLEYLTAVTPEQADGLDVIQGLSQTPKSLPPKYFYDERGSRLFEQITQLPEYYLTRTETQILQQSADAIATLTGPCDLIELGSGSSTKTRLLLDAYQRQGTPLHYLPVDVSGTMVEESAQALLQHYPQLTLHGLIGIYEQVLAQLPPSRFPRRLLAFIGSTLGNLSDAECDQFLTQVSQALAPGDYFLLGLDLRKPVDVLEAAYNDSQGVTAAFNLNLLHHLNWRFQGNLDPSQFRHVAQYNPVADQIEIYIESLQAQTARLKALDLTVTFAAGERLLSELSRKFDLPTMAASLQSYGLHTVHTFTDPHHWFGLLLCQRQPPAPH